MPLDQPTITDADVIRRHTKDAANWLFRSMECNRALMRMHCCGMAANELLIAAGLTDGEERRILAAYCRQAEALAGQFYGDGMGVQRLLDELVGRFGYDLDAESPGKRADRGQEACSIDAAPSIMEGIFRTHNCVRCKSGERACVRGNPRQCEWAHARND